MSTAIAAPRSPLRRHHRHITTHNLGGVAIFSHAIPTEAPVRPVLGGDMESSLMYINSEFPVSMAGDRDLHAYEEYIAKPPAIVIPNGTVCRTVDLPSGYQSPMHRTISCDFGVVLEGEVALVLDSGEEKVLKRGDVAVQRGTNHAWRNVSPDGSWARMLFVLQHAHPVYVEGRPLDLDEGGID